MHIHRPECYPSRAPALVRRAGNECRDGPILKGAPLVRALDGEAAHRRGDPDKGKKKGTAPIKQTPESRPVETYQRYMAKKFH